MSTREQRRAPRKPVGAGVVAIDVMTERPLGNLCNISANGLMLLGNREPVSGGVYQARLSLPGAAGTTELGLQEQWHEAATTPGQFWSGYRIIAIAKGQNGVLERWLQQA